MTKNRPGMFINFIVRGLIGIAIIFFVNEFLSSKGMDIQVGINGVSIITSGIFGLPGVALLYGILVYQRI